MAKGSRGMRNRNNERKQNQVNLVSARSRSNTEANKLSRLNAASGYSETRKKRSRNKRLAVILSIAAASVLVAAIAATVAYGVLNGFLARDVNGNVADFSSQLWEGVLKEPEKPEDPFWMLMLGTDELSEPGYGRTDTMILTRVDQVNKTAAMISIPRDSYIDIPGYGRDKINAAYSYGEQETKGGGVPLTIKTVSALADVNVAYFAQVDLDGVVRLVDGLGGVTVDVPVEIEKKHDSGNIGISAGLQTLNGQQALTFCRSRDFLIGDYQRQANQRTFLQALVKQILASNDPIKIASTVTNIASMTHTNLDIAKIVKIAQGMQGMQESSIHTYTVPSTTKDTPTASYVIVDEEGLIDLIKDIESGIYPPPQESDQIYTAAKTPDSYQASGTSGSTAAQNKIDPKGFTVDVKNGCGIDGSATSISDKLVLAGYKKGEVGNTDAYIYDNTLIIYKKDENRAAANDIKAKMGYGKVIASEGRYEFAGDILVVVGSDYVG